jgi:hypothetical protein
MVWKISHSVLYMDEESPYFPEFLSEEEFLLIMDKLGNHKHRNYLLGQ